MLHCIQIKSTDSSAFEANPSKGIINPRETATIPVLTIKYVDSEYAKILSQKNKFLIEYVLLERKPNSVDEAASELKSSISQSVKLYINTSSVRGPASALRSTN